jgi:kinesin family protein 18/19
MIANISPSIMAIEETLSTLKYASRAKNIKTILKKNIIDVDHHTIKNYDEAITNLKAEAEELRHKLAIETHNQRLLSKVIYYLLYNRIN